MHRSGRGKENIPLARDLNVFWCRISLKTFRNPPPLTIAYTMVLVYNVFCKKKKKKK